jgi:hypothetical protein
VGMSHIAELCQTRQNLRGLISPRTCEADLGRCRDVDGATVCQTYFAWGRAESAVNYDDEAVACRPKAMIIKPDSPDSEELSERHAVGFAALQPHLTSAVVGMHGGLDCANPVDSDVRRDLDCGTIHGDAEIDDVRILVTAQRLRFQAGSGDVGDGVPRRAPWRRRASLCGWCGRSLVNAPGQHEQHDEHSRPRGVRAPPTARHGSRIERQ